MVLCLLPSYEGWNIISGNYLISARRAGSDGSMSASFALAQIVACLLLVQQVWGSIPSGEVNFHLKIFDLRARRGEDVHFLIARLYVIGLD